MHFANRHVTYGQDFRKTELGPTVTDSFDEVRFAALLHWAGPGMAMELAQQLDDDLTKVGLALTRSPLERTVLYDQSHILLSIAGTIGATTMLRLARQVNTLAVLVGPAAIMAMDLIELRRALNEVIVRVRSIRQDLERAS